MKKICALMLCLCIFLCGCGTALPTAQPSSAQTAAINAPEAEESPIYEPSPTPEPSPEPECAHSYSGGICTKCGDVCLHGSYIAGFCSACGIEHNHGSHAQSESPFTAPVCRECGAFVQHNWVNGVCTECSQQFEFIEETLPLRIVSGEYASQHGTVETFTYPSHYYNPDGQPREECEKNITVYVPCGYDGSKPYDLMIMCVGNAGPSTLYFDGEYDYYGIADITGAAEMLDVLTENKLCKPFIGVTIEYRSSSSDYSMRYQIDSTQVECELKNDILPMLCEKYSLYPQNASPEELLANREHLAFWGVSYGGYITHSAALEHCFEIFGWYSSVSGGWTSGDNMAAALRGKELPIYYFYSVDGEPGFDECANASKKDYLLFEQLCPLVTTGVNGYAGTIAKGAHDATTWITALFNYARLCFHTA